MGPVYAALTVVTGGCSNALIRIPIVEHGPVQAVVVQRLFTVIFIVLFVVVVKAVGHRRSRIGQAATTTTIRPPRERGGWRATVALLVAMGAIDGTGFIGFAFGMAVAPAWFLGLVSQTGRLAAALVATALFRENLRPIQWTGIGLVATGLVLAVWPS